jgi:hypothetical protein
VSALGPHGSTWRWRKMRARVLAEDGWRGCMIARPDGRACGMPASCVDHIVRRRHGGTDVRINLRPACRECNRGRESYAGEMADLSTLARDLITALDQAGGHRGLSYLDAAMLLGPQWEWVPVHVMAEVCAVRYAAGAPVIDYTDPRW